MTAPRPEPRVQPRTACFTWSTVGASIDPSDLSKILEDLHTHAYGSGLPGFEIVGITYEGYGKDLTITMRETS